MTIKEYTTSYSGANPTQDADPITGVQPDLADETAVGAGDGDEARSSHPETLRDKLQAAAKMVGDSVNSPSGSLAEIIDRDHANGDARQVRFRERATDPTNAANKGFIYTKDVSSATEFFYLDSAGNAVQITSGGSLAGGGGGSSPLTTKGDIYTHSTLDARLAVGSNGQVLVADSTETTGLKWVTRDLDTSLPILTHSGVSQVDVAASPGNNSTIRLTLQDDKQRTHSGTVSFDPSTGVVDGGLDTGAEASSTWYYLYLVPSSGDDNVLHVRGSVTPPTTGPTGYTNWRYVGAVYNDSSSDIRQFHQHGSKFLKPRVFVSLGTTSDAGPVSHSVASQYLPATAYAIVLDLYIDSTTGACTLQAWPDGAQAGANWALSYCKGSGDSNITYYEVPTPTTPKVIYFKKTGTTITGSGYSSLGWVDGWLSRA